VKRSVRFCRYLSKRMEKADDVAVLRRVADYRVLTVSQLTELAFVSEQMARRWIRRAERESWVTKHAGVLEAGRGRPEAVLQLSEPGIALVAKNGGINSQYAPLDARLFRHQLLISTFRLQLRRIEDDDISITFRTSLSWPATMGNGIKDQGNDAHLIPDGVFSISSKRLGKCLLFLLEADCSTESLASSKGGDIRAKIINYRGMLGRGLYRKYESHFGNQFRGFRVLFVTTTAQRCEQFCRLVRQMSPTDFVWVADQKRMSEGLAGSIWHRGGREETGSILGGNNPASRKLANVLQNGANESI
jgi:hypothetical protein